MALVSSSMTTRRRSAFAHRDRSRCSAPSSRSRSGTTRANKFPSSPTGFGARAIRLDELSRQADLEFELRRSIEKSKTEWEVQAGHAQECSLDSLLELFVRPKSFLDPLHLFLERLFVAVVIQDCFNKGIAFGGGQQRPITVPEILNDQPAKKCFEWPFGLLYVAGTANISASNLESRPNRSTSSRKCWPSDRIEFALLGGHSAPDHSIVKDEGDVLQESSTVRAKVVNKP